jgi:hypothetical protein
MQFAYVMCMCACIYAHKQANSRDGIDWGRGRVE